MALFVLHTPASQAQGCKFDGGKQAFVGTPLEQARCLLRVIKPGGVVTASAGVLPPYLQVSIGQPFKAVTRDQLVNYLKLNRIADREIGGPVQDPLSRGPGGQRAIYFVIHDTSEPLESKTFPPNINDRSFPPNNLERRETARAHVYVSRTGASKSSHYYDESVGATKREYRSGGEGLFLHHELVQPRIKGSYGFHAIAPTPGFTSPQLKRLALLYVVASLRRGTWLIPAYHCAVDEGIPDGHDDPQNFDLAQWSSEIETVVNEILSAKR